MEALLEEICGIPFNLLSNYGLRYFSTAQRMCWAARRETTRKEDMAYCLLGIFSVNMTLSYGEGHKAFRRLQEEIIKKSTDQTIFAWGLRNSKSHGTPQASYSRKAISILANYPSDFVGCEDMVPCESNAMKGFEITHGGIRTELRLRLDNVAILDCYQLGDIRSPVHIQLVRQESLSKPFLPGLRFPMPELNNFLMARSAEPGPATYFTNKYMPIQRRTVILQTEKFPRTSALIKRYHDGSLSILKPKNVIHDILHLDRPVNLAGSQNLLLMQFRAPYAISPQSSCRAFLLFRTMVGPFCVKIEFYPTRDWMGRRVYRYRCLLAVPASWPSSFPLEELECLRWRSSLILNDSIVSITRLPTTARRLFSESMVLETRKKTPDNTTRFRNFLSLFKTGKISLPDRRLTLGFFICYFLNIAICLVMVVHLYILH
ncbi:hypothetical protein F4806DRAFT_473984, partial [Annulohypoxylon nitens]